MKFKAKSKILSRLAAQMTNQKLGLPPVQYDSDSDDGTGSAKKQKRPAQANPLTSGKVTFDFNGKIIAQKEPTINIKTVTP